MARSATTVPVSCFAGRPEPPNPARLGQSAREEGSVRLQPLDGDFIVCNLWSIRPADSTRTPDSVDEVSARNTLQARLRGVLRFKIQPLILWLACRPKGNPTSVRGRNWPIPDGLLTANSACICAGAGEEIDLEIWLAETVGAQVLLLDPTPRARRFVESLDLPANLIFEPLALWRCDETLRLFAPTNPEHVSHSLEDPGDGRGYFDAVGKSVESIMADHDLPSLDLLKMNIEGAEYAVLDGMLGAGIRPRILTCTFEGPKALRRSISYVRKLKAAGYRLEARKVWAFTFVLPPQHNWAGGQPQLPRSG